MQEYNPFGPSTQNNGPKNETNPSPFAQNSSSETMQTTQGQFPQFQDTATKNTFSKDWQKAIGGTTSHAEMDELAKRIESAKSNGWGNQIGKLFSINKKRLAIVAISALFLFGGVQAFNNKGNINLPLNATVFSGLLAQNDSNEKDVNKLVQELDLILDATKTSDKNESFITKTASAGEGITHLARYAIRDYLANTGKSLSPEEKIYAEDYVQNRIGSEMLEIGEKLSFSNNLLNDAIDAAQDLENWQIDNLTQYTVSVSLL